MRFLFFCCCCSCFSPLLDVLWRAKCSSKNIVGCQGIDEVIKLKAGLCKIVPVNGKMLMERRLKKKEEEIRKRIAIEKRNFVGKISEIGRAHV